LQQVTGTLKELDATICAITPQLQEASRPLIAKHKITFDLLSDHGNEYAAKLGIRFELPNDLKQAYLSFGIDLAARNGEDSWTLPMPGRFVVDIKGVLRAVDVDPDYRYRPEPDKTVKDVKVLR
jgi:peroxiredoxin